jgi:hypothetical protein
MVQVTERAKEVLLQTKLSARIQDPAVGLRLASAPSGSLALVADRVKAGDQVVKHRDSTVLLVQAELSELALAGATVDCTETSDGKRELVLRRAGAPIRDAGPRRRR